MATLKEIACDVAHRLNQNKRTGDDSALNDYFETLSVDDLIVFSGAILKAKIVGTDTIIDLGDGPAGSAETLTLSHAEMRRVSASLMASGSVQRAKAEVAGRERMPTPLEVSAWQIAQDKNADSDKKMESLREMVWDQVEKARHDLSRALVFAKKNKIGPPKKIVCPDGDDDVANPAFDEYYAELGKLIDQHPLGLPPGAKRKRKKTPNGV